MAWHRVGDEADFQENQPVELVVAGLIVAVTRADDKIFALDGICPHQGGPLGKGTVDGCVLTCPWHGWQFDLRDGQSLLSPHVKHPTILVEVRAGEVYVDLPAQE